ncbi:sulfite exporter TauE/SafE family protein [Sinomicrobium sp. M5D2P17]
MLRYLPLFIVLSLIAEILGTVGGFGSSVFFVPIANYFLDFQSVLGITALFHLASNVTKIAFFRKGIDKKLVINLGIPAVIFVTVGAYGSKFVNTGLLSLILGGFLIVFSALFLLIKKLHINPTTKNAIAGGTLSGLSAGLLGTGGAIRGMTMAAFNLNKDRFIATSAIIDLAIDMSRSVVYSLNGYVRWEHLYLIFILLVVSIVGTYIGKKILNRFSHDQFKRLVLFLILIIGIVTIVSNVLVV